MLPTPPATIPSSRSRRTLASSSSDDSAPRPFGISNVKYRVGAPPLRSLPLDNSSFEPFGNAISSEAGAQLQSELETMGLRFLIQRGILSPSEEYDAEFEDRVMLFSRYVPDTPESAEPTLFVVAPWSEDSRKAWQDAVRTLKIEVDNLLIGQDKGHIDVTIEICAPELVLPKYIGPVIDLPDLEMAWPSLLEQVCNLLESFVCTKSCMTSVCLFRLGFSKDVPANPITLYVSVSYDSDETAWPPVIRAIQSCIAEAGWPQIEVHIEHGTAHQYAFDLGPPSNGPKEILSIRDNYPLRVNMGADVSAATYIPHATNTEHYNSVLGTLGCFVQLKLAGSTNWTTFALTSHHVTRAGIRGYRLMNNPKQMGEIKAAPPPPNTTLSSADYDGRGPEHAMDGSCAPMESPSRLKHNHTIAVLDDLLKIAPTDPALLQEKARKQAFFDNGLNILGTVWTSSGFRKRAQNPASQDPAHCARLDWALVEVKGSRQGTNALPGLNDWRGRYKPRFFPRQAGMTGQLKQPGTSLKTMANGTPVFKLGAITGLTSGHTSTYKSGVNLEFDNYMNPSRSTERMVIGHISDTISEGEFAFKGDSGAIVYDADGKAAGLLISGKRPMQAKNGFSYVTPIEDVFASIIKHADGQIQDVRIA